MCAHAAGESARQGDKLPHDTHAVVVEATADELAALEHKLQTLGVKHSAIREDGQLWAIGVAPGARQPVRKLTSSFPLYGGRRSAATAT